VPHPAQRIIHAASDRRFRIICTGRRFGKTLCLAADVLDRAHNDGGEYGWIAPTYNVAERGIEAIRTIASEFVEITGRAPSVAKVPTVDGGMAKVWFLSADNPDNIRGYGFKGLVVDEAASISPDVWNFVLRPTISQTLGWAVLISTPKARNWFYDLFTRGQDPAQADYKSFRFRSIDNPKFPLEEWEDAKRTLPSDVFKQEYEAQFLEDSAGVFRNIEACLLDAVPQPTGDIAIGCDLAKHTDWTVLIAMDRNTGACVDMDRFQRLDWPIQKDRILAFCRKWRGLLIMDATGAGDPIYDDLARVWPRIEPVKFTNQKKVELIQRLIVAVEQRQVSWPRAWEVLTNEMKRYEYAISPSGAITYSAPEGFHDDTVIALALAVTAGHRQTAGDFSPLNISRKSSIARQHTRALP
jgi:hypothetical protein